MKRVSQTIIDFICFFDEVSNKKETQGLSVELPTASLTDFPQGRGLGLLQFKPVFS